MVFTLPQLLGGLFEPKRSRLQGAVIVPQNSSSLGDSTRPYLQKQMLLELQSHHHFEPSSLCCPSYSTTLPFCFFETQSGSVAQARV